MRVFFLFVLFCFEPIPNEATSVEARRKYCRHFFRFFQNLRLCSLGYGHCWWCPTRACCSRCQQIWWGTSAGCPCPKYTAPAPCNKKKNKKKKRLIGRWCSKRNVSRRNGYLGARVVAHTGRPPERIRERQLHVEQFVFVQVQSKPWFIQRRAVIELCLNFPQPMILLSWNGDLSVGTWFWCCVPRRCRRRRALRRR